MGTKQHKSCCNAFYSTESWCLNTCEAVARNKKGKREIVGENKGK